MWIGFGFSDDYEFLKLNKIFIEHLLFYRHVLYKMIKDLVIVLSVALNFYCLQILSTFLQFFLKAPIFGF